MEIGNNSAAQLLSLVERVERLSEEIDGLGDDRKEVYAEAKAAGFDCKILRRAIALRKIPAKDREQIDAVLDLYMETLDAAERKAAMANAAAGE